MKMNFYSRIPETISGILGLIILFFTTTVNAQFPGQWSVNGPDFNAEVSGLIIDDQNTKIIHLGTLGLVDLIQPGLFRTTNGGVQWDAAPPPLDKMSIESLYSLGGTLFVSGYQFRSFNTGTYRSVDRGLSWERLSGEMADKIAVSMVSANGVLYAGAATLNIDEKSLLSAEGVYRSFDNGDTWETSPGLDGQFVTSILHNPVDGRLYAGTGQCISERSFCGGTANGIYVSEDGGDSWTNIVNLQGVDVLAFAVNEDSAYAGTVYAGTRFSGLLYSPDGQNWIPAAPPLNAGSVRSIEVESGFVFTSHDSSAYRSADGGITWAPMPLRSNDPLPENAGSRVTTIHSDGFPNAPFIFVGSERNGVYRSPNLGDSWDASRPAPMDSAGINILVSDGTGTDTYAGTLRDGVYLSPNGSPASVWQEVGRYTTRLPTANVFVQGGSVLAFGLGGIYRSADAGETWRAGNPKMNIDNRLVLDMAFDQDVQTFYAAVSSGRDINDLGIWKSVDGITWDTTALRSVAVNAVEVPPGFGDGAGVYAAGENGLFVSLDAGATFNSVPILDGINVMTVYSDTDTSAFETQIYAGISDSAGIPGLYTGSGLDWTAVNDLDLIGVGVSSMAKAGDNLYAGTINNGVFYSTDDGVEWNRPTTDMTGITILYLASAVVDGTVYIVAASDQNGLFFSEDEGINWQQADYPAVNAPEMTGLVSADNVLYASSFNFGVMRSLDGGRFWRPLVTDLTEKSALGLGYMELTNRLFLSTAEGVFTQDIDLMAPFEGRLDIFGSADTSYTNANTVQILIGGDEADSMLISQDFEVVSNADSGWLAYSEAIDNYKLSGPEGQNQVFIRFKDYSWNLSGILADSIILDKTKPAFAQHTPPAMPAVGQLESVYISQQVEEPNLDYSDLLFRRIGDKFTLNSGSLFDGDTAEIDYAFLTNRGLDYRITSQDLARNIDTLLNIFPDGDTLTFFSLPVQLNRREAGRSRALPGGTGASAFSIVSLPMDFSGDADARTAFGDLGKYGRLEAWRYWSYGGNSQWREGEGQTLQPGSANFLILRESRGLTNSLTGTSMPTTAGVRGEIPGWSVTGGDWTLIGNPYNAAIKLNQLKLRDQGSLLSDQDSVVQVWAYPGSWKNQDISLEPWSGLMVWSAQNDQIVFANKTDPFLEPVVEKNKNTSPVAGKLQENEWQINIATIVGDQRYDQNYFGWRNNARDEQDRLDRIQLPVVPGGVAVGFPHPEWEQPRRLAADIRATGSRGSRWELRVEALTGKAVSLLFENIEQVPENFDVLVVDEATGLLRDLRLQPQLQIHVPEQLSAKTISILVGDQDFLSLQVGELQLVPGEFSLRQNYPNPFNPATTIRYGLPSAGAVTLTVYDLLGREVMTLENRRQRQAGFYETIVDMSRMSSGVYFYRLTVDGEQNFSAVKRMLLIK